ncbi:hypothetical protein D3C72_1570100 [compost metagenome]
MDGAAYRIHRTAQAQGMDIAVLALAEGVATDRVEAMLQAPLQGKEAVPVGFLMRVVDQIDVGEGLGRRRGQQRTEKAKWQGEQVHAATPREGASSLPAWPGRTHRGTPLWPLLRGRVRRSAPPYPAQWPAKA